MNAAVLVVSEVLAYFSVASTLTICRVASIEDKVNRREKEIARNERNIAVLLEKVTTIEHLVREVRQEMARLTRVREDIR